MLPNRMQLNKTVEEQLRKLKTQTGITPNVASRIAFFFSIESDYTFQSNEHYKLDGALVLDKYTWLGKTQLLIELILRSRYPELDNKGLQAAWASHVEHGLGSFRNHKSIQSFVDKAIESKSSTR